MGTMREEIGAARTELKEINTGISGRLLNLEGNAVNRIQLTAAETRIDVLEAKQNEWDGSKKTLGIMWGVATFVIPLVITYFMTR